MVAGQAPDRLARQMGARLALTHLHDNDGSEDQHRPAGRHGPNGGEPGGGVIDWPALIAALRDVGYPERNVWMLEGGTQVPGDVPDRLLEEHRVSFLRYL
jgi:sugar phosphate isomerase/epimerase